MNKHTALFECTATKLTEALPAKYEAAKKFWDTAKNKKIIDTFNFFLAYEDELKDLGLLSEFDSNKKVKSKESYGVFKKAVAEHPSSYAAKAALKFASLQFWENAKTVEEVEQEQNELRIQKQEAEKLEQRQKIDKVLSMESIVLEEARKALNATDFTEYLKAYNTKKELEAQIDDKPFVPAEPNKDDYEISCKAVGVGLGDNEYDSLTVLFKNNKIADHDSDITTLYAQGVCSTYDLKKISIENIDGSYIYQQIFSGLANCLHNRMYYLNKDIKDFTSRAQLANERKKAGELKRQKALKINTAIKNAVADGTQPDQDTIDELDAIINQTRANIASEVSVWADSTTDNLFAARSYALYNGVDTLKPYLQGCHWESDISSYKDGQSEDEFEYAIVDLIEKASDNTIITFL